MPTKLEQLLALLEDNVWHNLDAIAHSLEIPENRLHQIVSLLAEIDLVQYNPATNQVKLDQKWKNVLIDQEEKTKNTQSQAAAVGTIIIPPQKTLLIQCTRITNLTEASLELEIRINKKISEIAISNVK